MLSSASPRYVPLGTPSVTHAAGVRRVWICSDYVFRCTRRALQTDPTEVAVEVIILEHLVLDPYTHEEDQPPSLQQKSRELLKLSGGCLSSSIS